MLINCTNDDEKVRFGYDFRDGPVEIEGYMIKKMLNHPDFIEVKESDGVDYTTAHHKTLKKLVEGAGGTYEDKDQAIAFLEAND